MNRGSADVFWAIAEGQDDKLRPGEQDIVRVQRVLPPAAAPAHRFYEVYQGRKRLGSIFQETPRHQLVAVAHGLPVGSFPATTGGLERARRAVGAAPAPRMVEEAGPAPVSELDLFYGRAAAPPPVTATRRMFLAAQAVKVAAKANLAAVESRTPEAHAAAAKANRAAAALQEGAEAKGRLLLKATQHVEAERLLRHNATVLAAQQEQARMESIYGFWEAASSPPPRARGRLTEDAELQGLRKNPPLKVKSPQYPNKFQIMIWSGKLAKYIPQGPPVSSELADEDLAQTKKAHMHSIKTLQGKLMQKKS